MLFGLCTLVTGPLWARKAWGVWWQWDVRLTTTLLLWFIFIAYLFARHYGGPGARKLAAGLALFGAADVPLIYFSVSIWRTIHPKTTVVSSIARSRNGMGMPLSGRVDHLHLSVPRALGDAHRARACARARRRAAPRGRRRRIGKLT